MLLAMSERRFVILKYTGPTPTLASCSACQLKFFLPLEMIHDPIGAEEHLRERYGDHKCKFLPSGHDAGK
jgi:hypothetical protein